ncbi:coatomer subunit alpha [Eurytemora carolleeae]|uniref:coatomer subunit alpha n=1 Tax=Eurytemora carolleeae TaxID=1294199 RepID=UPI000C77A3F8|nr:coatomer subunit alpha [Eurytemora carolleeae]|eukprot:XP_023345827.1 coatomer subunit alpha-like [Eurytemora affinis]
MDVVCSYIFEGFSSGVQWVKIHQALPFLCAADGKVVRVYNTETSREVRTLVGHFGNISSGVFCLGFEDMETLSLVTVSADKTLKVWSLRTGITLDTFPLNTQPASLVAAPNCNLMGLVHGNGLAMIKLYKHRPVHTVYKHHLYLIRENWLTHVNTERKKETKLFKILEVRNQRVQSASYNPGEHAVLVNYTRFNLSSFQLYFIQETTPRQSSKSPAVPSIKSSPGDSALWVSNSRFSHIDNTGRVVVKNLKNQDVNFAGFSRGFLVNRAARTEMNIPKCDKIFQGYVDQEVVLRDTGYLVLYSLNQRRRLANINLGLEVPKQVIWNQDGTKVAILTSKCVRVCDKQLKEISRFR